MGDNGPMNKDLRNTSKETEPRLTPTAQAAKEWASTPMQRTPPPRLSRQSMPSTRLGEVLWQAKKTLSLYADISKPSASAMRFLIAQLEAAQRVTLEVPLIPDGTDMSMVATLRQHGRGLMHPLSRPLLVEYDHGGVYDSKAGLTQALSTRRMALVVPMETEFAVTTEGLKDPVIEPDDRGALLIWSINYFEERKEWEFAPSAAIIPRSQAFYSEDSNPSLLQRLSLGWQRQEPQEAQQELGEPITVRFQEMLPELLRQLDSSEISRIAREVSMDACWAALGVLTALTTSNVAFAADDASDPREIFGSPPLPLSARINEQWVPLNPFQGEIGCDRIGRWIWKQGHVGLMG